MPKIQDKLAKEIKALPDSPGVYFFMIDGKFAYIGKATSLRNRVKSYFMSDIAEKRGPLIERLMKEKLDIKFEKTDSVLEALLLEAELIKKYSPEYNTKGKDQRSFNFVAVTDEEFPRILVKRSRELAGEQAFGPFPNSRELRSALRIVRKIFPYRDRCVPNTKPCFNYQLGLCPGVCAGIVSSAEYKKTIRNIKLFFQGKKKDLMENLNKEMKALAKQREFEKAEEIKRQIFSLQHINDVALIQERYEKHDGIHFRIEAYDISHTSGQDMVGVMTVLENGEVKKSDYRMFKIKGQRNADDTKALSEVLERRFKHSEWPYPDLIVVDGGKTQLNTAKLKIKKIKLKIPAVSVVKDDRHKPREILGNKILARKYERAILLANAESHRFAISFHKHRRSKALFGKG